MTTKPEGYRYIRAYRSRDGKRRSWALYEVQGGKKRRVGTARDERSAYRHIDCEHFARNNS